jgi:osmotically-inducible protein OsmY
MKTDTKLQQDVIAELSWEPSIKATQIGVEVKDGVVTLAGHVDSYSEKWDAEKAAQRVAGVLALTVEIEVKLPGLSKRTDVEIAAGASNVLFWVTNLPKDHIKVMVENGWLTLNGEVDWDYQRQDAARAVRYLTGVTGLSNNIAIKRVPTSTAVKADIESALNRRAVNDGNKITVAIHGEDVTLSGTVHSYSERELARNTAWGSAGVRNVVDKLTVTY